MSISAKPRIAIVGGGIAGLSAAWQFQKAIGANRFDVKVFESGTEPGGVLKTEFDQGFLIESSADMFVSQPDHAMKLCGEIGFAEDLIGTNPVGQRAYIVSGKKLLPVPQGLSLMLPSRIRSLLESELLSVDGRARFLKERFVSPLESDQDESFEQFAVRRFGREAFEKIFQPLVGGIYTADSAKLSMRACLQRFVDLEKEHGSLIAAGRKGNKSDKQSSGARYGLFNAPREGFSSLVSHLVKRLTDVTISCSQRVTKIESDGRLWALTIAASDGSQTSETFDSVIMATPARVAGRLLSECDNQLSQKLGRIPYASSAVVALGCADDAFASLPSGFGFVVPESENRPIIACSFSSNKFAGRAPEGHTLMRVFLGGAKRPELVDLEDDSLIELAATQLNELIGLQSEKIKLKRVFRWRETMPQYHVGHVQLVDEIFAAASKLPGIELAGASYRGVGIPACVESGKLAAERVVEFFGPSSLGRGSG